MVASPKANVGNKRVLQLDHTLPDKRACGSIDAAPHWLQPEVADIAKPRHVDIRLNLGLVLLAQVHRSKDKSTKYDRSAMDERANSERLAKPSCPCRCGMHIQLADLVAFNSMFNSITAADRSEILRHAYSEAGCAWESGSVSAKRPGPHVLLSVRRHGAIAQ